MGDLLENAAINSRHDAQGRACIGLNEPLQRCRALVELARPRNLKTHHVHEPLKVTAGGDGIHVYGKAFKVLLRKIDPPAGQILTDISYCLVDPRVRLQ